MQIFHEYIEPLNSWIQANPKWALICTFLISLSESLAIVGSIIPGSVTMTAVGIMAGSGLMRIDFTFIAAILGAVGGDSLSYFIGQKFKDSLPFIWPFKRNPTWLVYGKEYFKKYGGKSVFVGRFIGPLRSLIPLVAGMMQMNQWHFLSANILSAIGWSILYLGPGILIGVASNDLSSESATKLFIVVFVILLAIWVFSVFLKWALVHLYTYSYGRLNNFWKKGLSHKRFGPIFHYLTPDNEEIFFLSGRIFLSLLIAIIASITLGLLVYNWSVIDTFNNQVYLFLQSIRNEVLDLFFIFISIFIKPISIIALTLAIVIYTIFHKDWRTLKFWVSLCLVTTVFLSLCELIYDLPIPINMQNTHFKPSFPAINLTYATALFGFLVFYISTRYRTTITLAIRIIIITILLLAGLGALYLGDSWFTSVIGAYTIGLSICLLHWVFYRRIPHINRESYLPILFSCLVLAVVSLISFKLEYKKIQNAHNPFLTQQTLSYEKWWDTKVNQLPLYASNRFGKHIAIFNIQYLGDLDEIEKALAKNGWRIVNGSFLYNLLMHTGKPKKETLPLMSQLYLNRKAVLIMSYKHEDEKIIVRFWRSNFIIKGADKPLWLGSIHPKVNTEKNSKMHALQNQLTAKSAYKHFLKPLSAFKYRTINIPDSKLNKIKDPYTNQIFLIQ